VFLKIRGGGIFSVIPSLVASLNVVAVKFLYITFLIHKEQFVLASKSIH